MKIFVLSSGQSPIVPIIESSGCEVVEITVPLDIKAAEKMRFAVSHGYRYILPQKVILALDWVVNLHVSLLPWNRGADPNLWSFLSDTPKGVSIHHIDPGVDTGPVIAQQEVVFTDPGETLATTYTTLTSRVVSLFEQTWPSICLGEADSSPQSSGGSYHRLVDKQPYMHLLAEKGWDTPVMDLRGKAL